MLLLLFLFFIITAACICCGFIFYCLILKDDQFAEKPLIFFIITGLIVLTALSQILALFVAVNLYTFLIIALLLAIITQFRRNDFALFLKYVIERIKSVSAPGFISFGIISIMILMLTAGPTLMDDTNSYHIQMIKWIREYGTVPGLANLHERYGFNSSWFSTVSMFGFSTEQFNLYTVLNGVISIWFCFYIISKAFSSIEKVSTQTFTGLLFLLLFSIVIWGLLRGNAASANYDFITTFIVFVLLYEIISTKNPKALTIEIIVWSFYLFTIRITNFPFLVPAFFLLITAIKKSAWKIVRLYISVGVVLVIPFVIRNVMLSGYLFYPSIFPDLFKVDWKVDRSVVDQLVYYIKYYNRINIMTQPLDKTATLDFPQWVLPWFRQLFYYDKIFVSASLAGFLFGIFLLLKKIKRTPLLSCLFFAAIALQLLIWFFLAPDPRFVYGCLLSGLFVLCFSLAAIFKNILLQKMRIAFTIVISLITTAYFSQKLISNVDNRNFVVPKSLPIPNYAEIKSDKIIYRIPEPLKNSGDTCCFGLKIPCLYKLDPNLKMRGETISKGFYLQKQ